MNRTQDDAKVTPPPTSEQNASTPPAALATSPATSSYGIGTGFVLIPSVEVGKKRRGGRPVAKGPKIRKTIIDDEVACKIFSGLGLGKEFLNSGKVLAWALQPDDEAFVKIHNYVANSQGSQRGVKILSILRVIPNAYNLAAGDAPLEHQLDFNEDPRTRGKFRMMLWHGTWEHNVASILENGLRLPKRKSLFGRGLYFADRISKSAMYCGHGYPTPKANTIGYFFLCDILLGNMYRAFQPKTHLVTAPIHYDSVQGVGKNIPDSSQQKVIDGCVWPLGPTLWGGSWGGVAFSCLSQNEYVVYNTSQVQPKYLVKAEFTDKPVH